MHSSFLWRALSTIGPNIIKWRVEVIHSRNISVHNLKQETPVVLSLRNKLLFVAGSNFPLILFAQRSVRCTQTHWDCLPAIVCITVSLHLNYSSFHARLNLLHKIFILHPNSSHNFDFFKNMFHWSNTNYEAKVLGERINDNLKCDQIS